MAITGIYARVSTDEQAEHGTSLEEQVRLCRQRLAAEETAEEFVDAGWSGTTMERPRLQALLRSARAGGLARLLVYDPDRLSRSAAHLLLLVDELRAAGVRLEFVNFSAEPTPDGRLLFTVRGAISEFEAHRIRQRLYAGKQARARANRVAGGTCIYGYRLNRATKVWEEEVREGQVVRLLFEWALTCGTPEITRRLNAQGVPARFGGPWQQSSVLGILRNPTYTGRMPQMGGLGSVPVPPLLDTPAFERVQQALQRRRQRPQGRCRHPYLLTGRLLCGVCGRAMCGGYGRPTRGGTTTYYACVGRARGGAEDGRCTNRYWRSDELDARVWEAVADLLADPAALDAAAALEQPVAGRAGELQGEHARLLRSRARLQADRARLLRALRRGAIREVDFLAQTLEVDAEERVLAERLASVGARLEAAARGAAAAERGGEAVRQVAADARALADTEQRRAVLAALGVRVSAAPLPGVRLQLGSEG